MNESWGKFTKWHNDQNHKVATGDDDDDDPEQARASGSAAAKKGNTKSTGH